MTRILICSRPERWGVSGGIYGYPCVCQFMVKGALEHFPPRNSSVFRRTMFAHTIDTKLANSISNYCQTLRPTLNPLRCAVGPWGRGTAAQSKSRAQLRRRTSPSPPTPTPSAQHSQRRQRRSSRRTAMRHSWRRCAAYEENTSGPL